MMAPVVPTRPHPAPVLDRYVRLAVLAVVAMGSTGLLLAVFGWFRPWAAVPMATTGFLMLTWLTRPGAGGADRIETPQPGASAAGAVALLVITAVTGFHAAHHGEHLFTDRDPGVYVTTARWLADEGRLMVPTPIDPFTAADTGIRRDMGFQRVDADDPTSPRAAQFPHLLPVLLAWGYWLGGAQGLLMAPALIGGLALAAVWSFASRLVRPWVATAAVTALALSPIHLHFTRDAYSEPLTQMLFFAGLAALSTAVDLYSPRLGFLAGTMLGAMLQARIDGLGLLILLPVWLGLALWLEPHHRQRLTRVVMSTAGGAAISLALGAIDLRWRSPVYLSNLSGELLGMTSALGTIIVASVVTTLVMIHRPPLGERFKKAIGRFAPGLGAALLVLGLGAWVVRPLIVETHGSASNFVAALQEAEGSTIDPTLRYSEDSMRWLQWYLGAPAVALGLIGAALALALRLRRPRADALSLLGLATLAVTVLYLWRPSISPDHLWVMRRYLVATVPAVVLVAAWVVDHLSSRLAPRRRGGDSIVAALTVSVMLVVPTLTASWPLRSARAQPGAASVVADVCDVLGDDAAIAVIPEDNLSLAAPLALRAWCGVPVGVVGVGAGPEGWSDLAQRWSEAGRQLHAVSRTPGAIRLVIPDADPVVATARGLQVERTLTRPARRPTEWTLTLAVASVPGPVD